MTTLIDRAGSAIATRTSRRGFLSRSALVGSAVVAAPSAYVLRPGSAYAAICRCNNQDCDCNSTCCDGYTEFCCTMTGENTCPTDTVPAGWWKVDASSFCTASGSAGPRYYLDCNAIPAGPCGPAGVTRLTNDCDCTCADGDCNNRKACCTAFRYGQCNQQISCLGPIVCRVVTCTPPWRFDPTCTTATATDNNTRWHHRPCLERPTPDRGTLPAWFDEGRWTLGFQRGSEADVDTYSFDYGQPGDIPVIGDWNGDGTHTIGVVRGNRWLLRNTNDAGNPDIDFTFGEPGDIPVVGDWNGDGVWGIGVRQNDSPWWSLRQTATGGPTELSFRFGKRHEIPVTGDWNGNGRTGIGVIRKDVKPDAPTSRWFLRHSATQGRVQLRIWFGYGRSQYVVGNWDGTGDQPAYVRLSGRWKMRKAPGEDFVFGDGRSGTPLTWQAGDWTPGQLPS